MSISLSYWLKRTSKEFCRTSRRIDAFKATCYRISINWTHTLLRRMLFSSVRSNPIKWHRAKFLWQWINTFSISITLKRIYWTIEDCTTGSQRSYSNYKKSLFETLCGSNLYKFDIWHFVCWWCHEHSIAFPKILLEKTFILLHLHRGEYCHWIENYPFIRNHSLSIF